MEPLKMAKPVILSGFYKIYDSKPTALSCCVAADVGMQITRVGFREVTVFHSPKRHCTTIKKNATISLNILISASFFNYKKL